MVGSFINELISFLLIAAAVYFFVVMPVTRMMARFNPPPPASTAKCPECLSDIPIGAKRCAFCTSAVMA